MQTENDTDTPSCAECDTALTNYTNPNPAYSGYGYGCPACFMPYCPFCHEPLEEACEHLIFSQDTDSGLEQTLFRNENELREALEEFRERFTEVSDGGGWAEAQKERAFGSLLTAYQSVEAELPTENTDDSLSALCEALPPIAGMSREPFLWESMGMGYMNVSGFFFSEPEQARTYYTEQAVKFITGLKALATLDSEEDEA